MKKKSIVVLMVMGLLISVFAGSVMTADDYIMRISTHFRPSDPPGMGVGKFSELVEEYSGGKIKTEVFFSSELGTEKENTEMVNENSIEATTSLAVGPGAWVPELAISELPYLYKDDEHMFRVMTGIRPFVEQLIAPYNFKPLGVINVGFRHMLNNVRPIYETADLKGLKMRGPNPVYVAMFNALGANGTTIAWSDIYMALQSGVIDGMEASPALIYSMKFHEQAQYLSKTNHIGAVIYFILNKQWFDSLPVDLQKSVEKAANEASKYQFKVQRESKVEMLAKLEEEGVKVNEVNDINEFRDTCLSFREKYVNDKGPSWIALYKKVLEIE
jgi:TRAP-type transport system periplasmic protein